MRYPASSQVAISRITGCRDSAPVHITGGKGAFTQWVWVELIESTETICLANTHQVHAEFI